MMGRQARRSGLVMGLETHMIAGSRVCLLVHLGTLTQPSPTRQARTFPRPCHVRKPAGKQTDMGHYPPDKIAVNTSP
jgi:hypothetical protein